MEYPIHVLQVGMSPYYGGTEAFIMSQYRRIDREKVQFDFLNVFGEEIACEQEIQELGGKVYPLNMARHKACRRKAAHRAGDQAHFDQGRNVIIRSFIDYAGSTITKKTGNADGGWLHR